MAVPYVSPTRDTELIDLQQQVARLQALLEATRQVHSTTSLEQVMMCVLQIVVRELEMPGALFTVPALTYGVMPPAPWNACARFPLRDKEGSLLTELVVALPDNQELSLYEQDFIEGLALQAAVAVENANYHHRNLEWVRLQRDLEAARAIQRSLLPQQMPVIGGYSVAVRSSACYEVGGDYVDIVALPDGSHIMAVADVAGKGLASAIVSTAFRSAFRAMALSGLPLEEMATRMNNQHYAEGPEARGRYVTAIFLKLDAQAHSIEVVNAGHNPGFLVSPGKPVREVHASATPLGLIPSARYKSEQMDFPPGSRLLLYTDGLTEVFHDLEEFGAERLRTAFLECNSPECNAILDWLWTTLHEFSGGAPQEDDMTALAILRMPIGESESADGIEIRRPSGIIAAELGETRMNESNDTAVEIRLPSRLGYEKIAMSTAASVAKLMGFPDDRIEDLKTAVAEACINAIEHGNRLNDNLSIGVSLSMTDDSLEVKVVDEGSGVSDRPASPDIDRKMHGEEAARGMGMFLIEALVDEAEWVKASKGNNSYVRLVIRLDKEGT